MRTCAHGCVWYADPERARGTPKSCTALQVERFKAGFPVEAHSDVHRLHGTSLKFLSATVLVNDDFLDFPGLVDQEHDLP